MATQCSKDFSLCLIWAFGCFTLIVSSKGCFLVVFLAGKIKFWLAWILQFAVKQEYLYHTIEWMRTLVPAAHSWDPLSTSLLFHCISDTGILLCFQVASVYILKQNSALKETKPLGTGSAPKSWAALLIGTEFVPLEPTLFDVMTLYYSLF